MFCSPPSVRILLDTHALLWFLEGSPRLGVKVRNAIRNIQNDVFVSPAAIWEISIKDRLGKLALPEPFAENRIALLPIEIPHILMHRTLPLHHHDPFDRLIIAQALEENLTIATCDPLFAPYGVSVEW